MDRATDDQGLRVPKMLTMDNGSYQSYQRTITPCPYCHEQLVLEYGLATCPNPNCEETK